VPVSDIDGARAALLARRPEELLGLAECGWLDVKGAPYQLDQPGGPEELAKDVAAFANTKTGGLLLVGLKTRKEHDVEIIEQVRPLPRERVDLDQYRKLIRARVIPVPHDVAVEWIDCEDGKGVLLIDVPAQPPGRLPYAVSGMDQRRAAVAVPIRDGDATRWLPQAEMQAMLAFGWTHVGGPSDAFLQLFADQRAFISRAVAATGRLDSPAVTGPGIGDGEPGWTGVFQKAHADLARQGLDLGKPSAPVEWDGPGVVQYFHLNNEPHGWVLAALPNSQAVAVDGRVWKEIGRAGSEALSYSPLQAVGYPAPDKEITRVVAASDSRIELTNGQWGKSWLVRDEAAGRWNWQPNPSFNMNNTPAAGNWSAENARILRLRAIATLPWADADDREITTKRREAIVSALPTSGISRLLRDLSDKCGLVARTSEWHRGPNRNAPDWLSYSSAASAESGNRVLEAEVMIAMPHSMNSSVVTCTELRVHAEGLRDALGTGCRLSIGEVAEFLLEAWKTSTEVLPGAVTDDPMRHLWASPPVVDLRIIAEEKFDGGPGGMRTLDDYIDLSPLGETDQSPLRAMSVAVTAPIVLAQTERRNITRRALAYMTSRYGYLDAIDWL
jgi:hypothetical protein